MSESREQDRRRPAGWDGSVSLPSLEPQRRDAAAPAGEDAGGPRPYADPYVAGVGLGLVLLGAFVVMGRGLGASGAFASGAAGVVAAAAPDAASTNGYFARYLAGDGPWSEWLLFEIGGVLIGGFLSALLAGRLRLGVVRGPNVGLRSRAVTALGGGAVMGVGAMLARGCTSGLALTGGALLAVGSWLFMFGAFAAGYAIAPLIKKAWQ